MPALLLAAALAHANVSPSVPKGPGQHLYTQYCSSCHGVDLRGGAAAPSLIGVGAADVDFWVSTGRMPAAVPWLEVSHRGLQPYLRPEEEALIVKYVASASPGGPAIPLVMTGGDKDRGHVLFQQNCQHCHGVDASGATIGGLTWAPSLHNATVTQLAEAIRVGPDEMPKFSEHQIGQADLDDIATYISSLRGDGSFTGLPITAGGAVPEGMYGWIAAGILSFFGFGFWSLDRRDPKNAKDPPDAP
jgi:ubiquinol-cytochrome c reductase cytochrome c subunit